MRWQTTEASGRIRRPWRWALLAALAVAVALLAGGAALSSPDNVHPSVYAWARQNPDAPVSVLVQTDSDAEAVADLVRALGGQVERRFRIVPILEASLPPDAVAAVAAHPSVAWISLNAPVVSTGNSTLKDEIKKLATVYPYAVGAVDAWMANDPITGQGVTVAVVDTGITNAIEDFQEGGTSRVLADVVVNANASGPDDGYGHGTHVAGIVGGNGAGLSNTKYIGIAPGVNLVDVKISDEEGNATLADVIFALEWIYENKDRYNIRVVNLSLHSSVAQSYLVDPLDAAVEFLWFNGILVVVAAGNLGDAPDAVSYPPANDPFVLTVGASDDMGTQDTADDVLAPWSSRGVTQDGFPKPEVVAPGRNIVSTIDTTSVLAQTYPERIVDEKYFRLSGTSMAAGVMSGVAALVFEARPQWGPNEVKCTLIATGWDLSDDGGTVPLATAAMAEEIPDADCNDGITPNFLISHAPVVQVGVVAYVLGSADPVAEAEDVGFDLDAVGGPGTTLDNVDWSAIKWDAIKWSAIKWDAIKWSAIKWDAIKWSAIKWDAIKWSSDIAFDAIKWAAIKWSAIKWDAIKWSAIKWSGNVDFDAIKWSAIKWDFLADQ